MDFDEGFMESLGFSNELVESKQIPDDEKEEVKVNDVEPEVKYLSPEDEKNEFVISPTDSPT